MVSKEAQAPEAKLEIPTVSEELYAEIREVLSKEGLTFIADLEPLSIDQLIPVTDSITNWCLGCVNPSVSIRVAVPPQMEVAINPKNLRIENSNSKSTDDQIRMIQQEEAALKAKLPQEIRDLIGMRMPSASVLAQLDRRYLRETGNLFFSNSFARTDDQAVLGNSAFVGRRNQDGKLLVGASARNLGDDNIFAVPVVVLPRKLTV